MTFVQTPHCSGCGRIISPTEYAVKFRCPQCGNEVIWRCEHCRKFGRSYRCVACAFEGP